MFFWKMRFHFRHNGVIRGCLLLVLGLIFSILTLALMPFIAIALGFLSYFILTQILWVLGIDFAVFHDVYPIPAALLVGATMFAIVFVIAVYVNRLRNWWPERWLKVFHRGKK